MSCASHHAYSPTPTSQHPHITKHEITAHHNILTTPPRLNNLTSLTSAITLAIFGSRFLAIHCQSDNGHLTISDSQWLLGDNGS
eukprot:scaffold148893_cov21-Tisochrysis_lutea.AAC.1